MVDLKSTDGTKGPGYDVSGTPYWGQSTTSIGHLVGGLRLPRGATITSVQILAHNSSGGSDLSNCYLKIHNNKFLTAATGANYTTQTLGPFSISPDAQPTWWSLPAITSPYTHTLNSAANNDSSWCVLEWYSDTIATGSVFLYALRFVYTYEVVDFGI